MKKLFFTLIMLLPTAAFSQLLVDPVTTNAKDASDFGVVLGTSEVKYDLDNGQKGKVERDFIGISGSYGISSDLDLYVAGAYIYDSSVVGSSSDDDGMILAAGARSKLAQIEELTLYGYGQVQYIAEDYGHNADGRLFETNFGLVSHVKLFDPVGLYAGIDLTPISEGEFDSGFGDVDFERDNLIGGRIGADIDMDTWRLRVDYTFISEKTLTVGVNLDL